MNAPMRFCKSRRNMSPSICQRSLFVKNGTGFVSAGFCAATLSPLLHRSLISIFHGMLLIFSIFWLRRSVSHVILIYVSLHSDNSLNHAAIEHTTENKFGSNADSCHQALAQLDRILPLLAHDRGQLTAALRLLPSEQQERLSSALRALDELATAPATAKREAKAPGQKQSRISITLAEKPCDLPEHLEIDTLAVFLHEHLRPYEDTLHDIKQGLSYALSSEPGRGGCIFLAHRETQLVGALVMLKTGMSGYIPENLLLFVAVDGKMRGRGIGAMLIKKAQQTVRGSIKLHVEHQNPARGLYERLGFASKYLEMRWQYQPSNH
ncbi:MAG: GNAT family N-acetyltransferase [Kiritimatiellia bacterium]